MLNTGVTKPYKTVKEQIEILRNRGLKIDNRATAEEVLKQINYYRLSAYSLTLRKNDVFYNGVAFEDVCELYYFDYDFRKIVYAYTAPIEIALRCYIAYHHVGKYGPLGYLDALNFEDAVRHEDFLERLDEEIDRSDDAFVRHHVRDLNSVFPFWVAIEVASFGALSMLFKNLIRQDRIDISKTCYRYGREYIENWLQSCVYARNIAAHGGRFYNRDLRSCPVRLPKKYKRSISPTRAFAFVFAIYQLLPTKEQQKALIKDLDSLYKMHPFALKKHMGFPDDWVDYFK